MLIYSYNKADYLSIYFPLDKIGGDYIVAQKTAPKYAAQEYGFLSAPVALHKTKCMQGYFYMLLNLIRF